MCTSRSYLCASRIRLTPLSLSSGAQHPESAVSQWYIDIPRFYDFENGAIVIAVANYVAIVCFMRVSSPRDFSCSVVDWKTGRMQHEVLAVRFLCPTIYSPHPHSVLMRKTSRHFASLMTTTWYSPLFANKPMPPNCQLSISALLLVSTSYFLN